MYHRSVLLKESIEALALKPGGIYVDATFGGGGHSREILKQLTGGRLYAFDQDREALRNTIDDPRITMINSNFRYLKNFLKLYKAVPVDGILADLGVSSHQFDEPGRGFSTRFEGALDMRMDDRVKLKAEDVLNRYEESRLAFLFREYADLRNAGRLARLIVTGRKQRPVATTEELKELLAPCTEKGKENKFFAQVFQALRIEVNQELPALKELLIQGTRILKKGGRIVIISYHSLEDRLVKDFFRSGNFTGQIEKDFYGNSLVPLKVITRKPVLPGEEEIKRNPRARSARLRAAEKL
ncbi:MAG TPA: 16S rRNA (cytosine(1402)-N(4))-methyltransferase RsmH [Bacteroidales bacterium]|nr:16S rRNA (cytosine(1402)-N(4))-methyltransferase RsmH [Bacteroidales bacterium]